MLPRCMNSFRWSCKLILLSLILIFGISERALAQYFPIHATVQWPSPQSPYLADYSTAGRDRLIVTLLNRDQQQPLLLAKLRLQLKSGGFTAKNREEVVYPMLELNTGVPIRLTSIDLAPYLQPQNLQTTGNLRNGQLPTGYAELSVQVVDYYTARPLSDWHTARTYLDVKKPPILNLPEQDAQVALRDPLFIRFQWTPRHQGLSGTEYEFVLKELPDNGVAPQSAFAYGQEIYRTHTRSTSLSYTHLDPLLLPNRKYAWQVRALSREGVAEFGMFEHGGYSEISWFTLNDQCDAPRGLKAQPRFAKVDLSWSKVLGTTGYIVECRPKTKLNVYEWSQTEVAGDQLTLSQLKPGWTYEWRVGTRCTGNRPVFSEVREFTLSKYNETLLADCGKEPVRPDLAQDPHLGIRAGDIVTIGGDYPMSITEVSPLGDGWYAGKGKTRLKSIIDAPIALRFDRLRINVDKYQIDGTVEASYDETKAKIVNLDYLDDGGKDIKPATIRMREHKMNFTLPDIPQLIYNPKIGELETTDAEGNPQTIKIDVPENASYESIFPMLVTDNKGNTYQISPSERNSEGTGNDVKNKNKGEKIELNCERVDRVGDFNTESLSSKYGYIHFKRGEGKYAFDEGQENWYKKSVKVDRFYKPFSKGYIAPWKLVPVGENDIVMAKYDGLKNIDLKKVRFVSEPNSTALPARLNETEQTWTITLRSVSAGASYDIFAVYEGVVIGKLCVVSYSKQKHKLTLVPINDAKLDKTHIERELNTVYAPIGIHFNVEVDERMRGNYSWEVPGEQDKLLSLVGKSFWGYDKELKESTEMLNLQKTYQQAAGTLDGVYLFVLNGATGLEGQKGDLLGEMPRKSRFGYIFAGNSPNTEEIIHTIAHELGHGIFTLQHTFDAEYGKGTQGKTNNLLDYPSNPLDYKEKTELAAFQWNIMASPAIFTALDRDREGQLKNSTEDLLALQQLEGALKKLGRGYIGLRLRCSQYRSVKKPTIRLSDAVVIKGVMAEPYIVSQSKTYLYGILSSDSTAVELNVERSTASRELLERIVKSESDLLLLHFDEANNLRYCEADVQNYPNICKLKDFRSITQYLGQFRQDIQACRSSSVSRLGMQEVHSLLVQSKKLFGNKVELALNKKIYRLTPQGKLEEIQYPLSDDEINSGQWQGAEEEYIRFTLSEKGILQVQAFGLNAKLGIAKGKRANLTTIAKNFRDKTNVYLERHGVNNFEISPYSQGVDLNKNEQVYADGDAVHFDNQAPYMRLVAEGWQVGKQVLKTGEISEKVYLDKTKEQVVLHAPGLVTGSIEGVAESVTDITSLVCLSYDFITEAETRQAFYKGLLALKDLAQHNPKGLVPILRDFVLVAFSGNSLGDWEKVSNPDSDKGQKSHFGTRGAVISSKNVLASGFVISKLPQLTDELISSLRKIDLKSLLARFSKFREKGLHTLAELPTYSRFKNLDELSQKRVLHHLGEAEESLLREIDAHPEHIDELLEAAKKGNKENEAWFKRIREGIAFNKERAKFYRFNEVYLVSPKSGKRYVRLDSYDPWKGEIVSRKKTLLYEVSDETAIRYLKELKDKYAPGSVIADVPSNKTGVNRDIFEVNQGDKLKGQMILEVPEQKEKISPKVLEYAKNHYIKIRDIKGKFYN